MDVATSALRGWKDLAGREAIAMHFVDTGRYHPLHCVGIVHPLRGGRVEWHLRKKSSGIVHTVLRSDHVEKDALQRFHEELLSADHGEREVRHTPMSRRWFVRALTGAAASAVLVGSGGEAIANCTGSDSCGGTNTCTGVNTCNPNQCTVANNCATNTCQGSNVCTAANTCSVSNTENCNQSNSCVTDTCTTTNVCTPSNTCDTDTCATDTCDFNRCLIDTCTTDDECTTKNTCINSDIDCGYGDVSCRTINGIYV
jgi:hypothetical protein